MHRSNAKAEADEGTVRLSIDTKTTVPIGNLSRGGKSRRPHQALDHDLEPDAKLRLPRAGAATVHTALRSPARRIRSAPRGAHEGTRRQPPAGGPPAQRRAAAEANRKRIQRLWRAAGLRVPKAKKRKRQRLPGKAQGTQHRRAQRPNEIWAYDFAARSSSPKRCRSGWLSKD